MNDPPTIQGERLPASIEPVSDQLLEEVLRRLIATYAPERIYLFGSAARGEHSPDSDYDLLVVVPDDTSAEFRRSARAYESLWGLQVSADVLVWTKSAFEARLHLEASLPTTVIREGRLLHAA